MSTSRRPVRRQQCVRAGGGAVLLLAAAATLGGCATDAADEEVSTIQSPLYLVGNKWFTNEFGVHVVPVCFDAAAVARPEYESVREKLRNTANTTWGAVANILFTEFGPCAITQGHLVVTIWDSEGGQTDGFGMKILGSRKLRISPRADRGNMTHELGHVLGFIHDVDRPDFINDASGTCREPNKYVGGNTLGTAANDRESIMNYRYCDESHGELSRWDIIGVQTAYGRKRAGSVVGQANRCLDVPGASFVNQSVPTGYGCHGGINQRWKHETDNSLSITSGGVTKCLDVPAWNNADGTSPTLYDCHGDANQEWALQNVTIRGLGGLCLELEGGHLSNGTAVRLGACTRWTFNSAGEIRTGDGGPGSKCIGVLGGTATNGQPLTLDDCHGTSNQTFTMEGGQLRVQGKCMDVAMGSPNDGTPVGVYQCGSSTKLNQQWNIRGPLVSLGKCLELPAAETSNGDTPALSGCSSAAGQTWEYYW